MSGVGTRLPSNVRANKKTGSSAPSNGNIVTAGWYETAPECVYIVVRQGGWKGQECPWEKTNGGSEKTKADLGSVDFHRYGYMQADEC